MVLALTRSTVTLMFPRASDRLVTDGRVYCARRRADVDLDLCLACEALLAVRRPTGAGASIVIRCSTSTYAPILREDPPRVP